MNCLRSSSNIVLIIMRADVGNLLILHLILLFFSARGSGYHKKNARTVLRSEEESLTRYSVPPLSWQDVRDFCINYSVQNKGKKNNIIVKGRGR